MDWRLDETATRLIKRGRIAPIIIVGLYNTPARLEEYADTPVGRNYMKLLVEEVKPFIDQTYRTRRERDNTAVMGSSMGGLVSLYLLWNYPHVFSKAACLSCSLSWKKCHVLKMIADDTNPARLGISEISTAEDERNGNKAGFAK